MRDWPRRAGEWCRRNSRFLRALGTFTVIIAALSIAQRPVTGVTWWVPFLTTMSGMLTGIALVLWLADRRRR